MKLTITKLCQDVLYFIRNNYNNISTLIFITTLIQIILNYICSPTQEELVFINNFSKMHWQEIAIQLSLDQQYTLIKIFITNSIAKLLSSTFLLGNILTILYISSTERSITYKHFNILKIIKLSIPLFPKLLLLIFSISIFIHIGLLLAIIPGILLAVFTSIIPIISIANNTSIIKSISISTQLSFNNIHLITPAILLWFITKTIIIFILLQHNNIIRFLIQILSDSITNTLFVIITIYLYRLYMIVK